MTDQHVRLRPVSTYDKSLYISHHVSDKTTHRHQTYHRESSLQETANNG